MAAKDVSPRAEGNGFKQKKTRKTRKNKAIGTGEEKYEVI